jgi:hypothetical protein
VSALCVNAPYFGYCIVDSVGKPAQLFFMT